jgi:TRAP-type C4-dicarboxylate transport system substrate-binding protein
MNARSLALSMLAVTLGAAPGAAAPEPKVVRWIVAHAQDSEPFRELLSQFASRVEKKTGGALRVEFVERRGAEPEVFASAYKEILSGQAELGQLPVISAGVPDFEAPAMFRSYAHAEAVFGGEVGERYLTHVAENAGGKARGLAFTYSGGYRILAGRAAVASLADLKGLRMRKGVPVLSDFVADQGAKLVRKKSRRKAIEDLLTGRIDVEETELNRLAVFYRKEPSLAEPVKIVSLTRHRMLITTVLANEAFLGGLEKETRRVLLEEVSDLAVAERKLSVELEELNRSDLERRGVRFVELGEAETQALRAAGAAYNSKDPQLKATFADVQAVRETPGPIAWRTSY